MRTSWKYLGVGAFALLLATALFFYADSPATAAPPDHEAAVEAAKGLGKAFTGVSKEAIPSVVTIMSNKVIQAASRMPEGHDEFNEFFWRFFGPQGDEDGNIRQRALGSGVIISRDGYIITNNHVVSNAEEISVITSDGDEYEAELIGTDRKTDVAVIKVEGSGFPAAQIGDSDDVEIGEWVLAVGSPFSMDLGATVTAGIVSGTGRGINIADYEDFIQTDAAINPGNSGGALVNLDGEVIGINTAIATRSGGSQGVGFAIPINMAADIKDALIRDGKVSRGWIGIRIQEVTKEFQEALDLPDRRGVLISGIEPGSPAEEAGLKPRDVIHALDGREIESLRQFRNTVAGESPGTDVELGIWRGGKDRSIDLELGSFPDGDEPVVASNKDLKDKLGLEVKSLNRELRNRFELDRREGVVVTGVKRGSMAAEKGMRPGDIILEVNQSDIGTMREWRDAVEDLEVGDVAMLLVERGGGTLFVALRVPE